MRIAFISQPRDAIAATGTQRGSVAIVTWELARRLANRHDVSIYAPLTSEGHLEERGPENVRVRRIPRVFRRFHKTVDFGTGLLGIRPPYFSTPFFFREYGTAVAAALAKDPPDVVHIQICAQFVPLIRAALPRARIVFHTHDELLTRLDRATIERRLAGADAVVTCSDYVTGRWQERFPARAAHIHTIGNGVDLERFHPGPGSGGADGSGAVDPSMLYVGRVSPEKGVHILAQAFERILARVPAARLAVVGSAGLLPFNQISLLEDDSHVASLRPFYGKGLLERINKQAVHASTSYLDAIRSSLSPAALARVRFHGPLEYMDLPALYRRARVLVAPSLCAEPFGLPMAEAMASGLPVIASRAGGMASIVEDGKTGILVDRGDVQGLAEASVALLTDNATLAGMRRASRQVAEARFGWEASAGRLENIYERLSGSQ
jgi:glycosyltransferase involved in cell wall biosynthesis